MRSLFSICWLGLIFTATTALCDVAFPDKAKPVEKPKEATADPVKTTVAVKVDAKATESSIQLPRKVLNALQGLSAVPAKKGAELSPAKTIAAGVALALGLAFGGLWLSRRKLRPGAAALLLGLAVAGVSTGSLVLADAAVPRKVQTSGVSLDDVRIEVMDGDGINVILTPNHLGTMDERVTREVRVDKGI
jgi:hypothetical protein